MKRVLYLTNIPAPYTVDFFNELGKFFELTVVFEAKNASERDSSWEKFDAINFKYTIIKTDKRIKKNFDSLQSLLEIEKYDLYIVGNYASAIEMKAIIWLRRHKKLYAIHADGGMISRESFIKYAIKHFFLHGANLYFSSGKVTTDYFVHYGADKDNVYQYPFSSIREGKIRARVNKEELREKLGLNIDSKIIVSVGHIIPRKGFDVLLKAKSLMKNDAALYIIGGEPTEELQRQIKELNLNNVYFKTFLPFDVILDYMAAADVFALMTREDIWGLVVNEALSVGTPVVSTNKCVAAVEMISDGINGYIVENEDAAAAADRIDYLLENDVIRERMFKNNIQKAYGYTIETMVKRYVSIIEKTLIKQ